MGATCRIHGEIRNALKGLVVKHEMKRLREYGSIIWHWILKK
jgi:hypothetical protein